MRLPSRLGVQAGVFVLLFSFSLFAQASADPVSAVTAALRAGEFARALDILEPALRQSSGNAQLWTLQGLAYSGEGHKKEALASFHNALKISPDYLPALEGAAQLAYDAGDREAPALLQHVLRLVPSDPTAHAMVAALACKRNNCPEAIAHFEQSGALLESQPVALREYGICLAKTKRYEKAITVLQKLVTLKPDEQYDRVRLAALQVTAGRTADAIETLQPALQHQPDSTVLSLAADAYEAQKGTPRAVELLRQAIVQDPRNIDLYLQFADLSFVHQSFQVGIDMIDLGVKLQPKAAPLYVARGTLYAQLADYDHAEADFETANELDPQMTVSAAARGMLAEQKDDLDKALAVVRAKLSKRPNDAFLLYVLADILVQKNPDVDSPEFKEAISFARQAAQLQPSLVSARDTLAKLYLQAGENQLAVNESRQSLRYNPDDQVALYHLIVGLRKTGHKAELPELLKQLADVRQKATREEGEHNRYKLVEQPEPGQPQEN